MMHVRLAENVSFDVLMVNASFTVWAVKLKNAELPAITKAIMKLEDWLEDVCPYQEGVELNAELGSNKVRKIMLQKQSDI